MSRYIVKIEDKYFEWSTCVDAPVTPAMDINELKEYIKDEYGRSGLMELPERLERVNKQGTSSHLGETVEDVILHNMAGKNGEKLTKEEILEQYAKQGQ